MNKFIDFAERLLNRRLLVVNNKRYRIAEIEFYLHNDDHRDSYVHCNEDQLQYNKFYFHKFANGTYKNGTFKGLDITFGDEETNTYFGILIRAVYDIKQKVMIEGPCNVVNRLLSDLNCDCVMDYVNGNTKKILIVRNTEIKKKPIWVGPRIGLSNKYPKYRNKLYRYVIYKDYIKREKTKLIQI